MPTLQALQTGKAKRRWTPTRPGWIGVDIGFRETKVAQLVRRGRNQHLFAKWRFPIPDFGNTSLWQDYQETIDFVAAEVAKLRPMFCGRRLALSLPFDQTALRLVDVPRSDDAEMRCMIREELASEFSEEETCFDYWDTAADSQSDDAIAQLAVVVVPAQRSQWVAQRFAAYGFDCRDLDAGLCGIARATAIASQDGNHNPPVCSSEAADWGLAIDMGWTSTRLLLVRNGEPGFCRVIPDSGCQTFIQSLQDRFSLSETQANLLLKKVGVGAPGKGSRVGPTAEIHSCLAPVLLHLTAEIRRTLQFAKRQLFQQDPRTVWLFGGGTEIRYISDHFADYFAVPINVWELPDQQKGGQGSGHAAFAGAIALSLLAWEHDPCT